LKTAHDIATVTLVE